MTTPNNSSDVDHEEYRLARYRALLRWRRVLYGLALPVAVALLVLSQGIVPGIPPFLTWPLLLLFAVAFVALMHITDVCPWCGHSFYNRSDGTASSRHAIGWLQQRRHCANCGAPHDQTQRGAVGGPKGRSR